MRKVFKAIYNAIPLKLEIFSVLKIIWTPKKSIFKHLHFKGIITVSLPNSKLFKLNHYGFEIENQIFWVGIANAWEKESLKLWIKLCEESEIIIDIGANTGIYSLVAKTVNSNAKVYAFEPVSRVFMKLKENIALNNFNIIPIEKAISNFDGNALIYDTITEHQNSVTVNKNLNSQETQAIETKIETVTLNTFIQQNNIKKIDLIKIDVETHEPEVLEGFSDYLFQYKPTMIIEISNNHIAERVYNIVKGLGYLYFNIDENGSIRQTEKIEKSDYYNYLLCNPDISVKIGLT